VEDLVPFAHLVATLRPWLPHLVLVGGWAHRLHRFHALAASKHYEPLRTRDADIAFLPDAPLHGGLLAALEQAGFTAEHFGDAVPPATHYHLGKEAGGFYAEFLTPLHGSGVRRDGRTDATLSKAGVAAQKLRHLDILLISPWTVRVGRHVEIPIETPADVPVPNPVGFIVQRLLIHGARTPQKRAQDVLYIHDTLELFGDALPRLHSVRVTHVRPKLAPRTARRAEVIATEVFAKVTDVIREAARIPQDRRLEAEAVRAACEYGLEEVLRPGR
jgi:hypothetical protein